MSHFFSGTFPNAADAYWTVVHICAKMVRWQRWKLSAGGILDEDRKNVLAVLLRVLRARHRRAPGKPAASAVRVRSRDAGRGIEGDLLLSVVRAPRLGGAGRSTSVSLVSLVQSSWNLEKSSETPDLRSQYSPKPWEDGVDLEGRGHTLFLRPP
jgi:hypothetical protein